MRSTNPLTAVQRFMDKVEMIPFHECWEWMGGKTRGYGRIAVGLKTMTTHRFSYITHNGDVPKGLHVLHSCDNPGCVNPKHLFLGTQKDNMDDMIKKGRGRYGKQQKYNIKGEKND